MFRFKDTLPTGRALVAFRRFTNPSYALAAAFFLLLPQFVAAQCYTMICNQNVPLPLGNNCTGTTNPSQIIQNTYTC